MAYRERMESKLTAAFAPVHLAIIDESHRHAGHGGAHPEGETHFRVEIVSKAFAGLSRVDRQRRVYDVLKAELAERVHALSLAIATPEETESPKA